MDDLLLTATVADLNDRIRIECLWDGENKYSFPSLSIYAQDYKTEVFSADNPDWINKELLNSLITKKAADKDVKECFLVLKQNGIKKKELKKVIHKAILLKML